LTPNVVGVVCALQSEAQLLGSATRRSDSLSVLVDGTLVCVSGMGSKAAVQAAESLLEAGAAALVSWGMAGGLDPALPAGTLLLPTAVLARNGQSIETSRAWRERLNVAVSSLLPAVAGKLITSDRAVASVAEKAALFRETGAAAVDMESLAVAQVGSSHRVPFLAVRAIVDSAGDVLPRAVAAAADAAGHLRLWQLVGALTLAPADLPALIRLARGYRAAGKSLAGVAGGGYLAACAFPASEHSPRTAVS
jgi:adenosylhomocysteine nucleosidase